MGELLDSTCERESSAASHLAVGHLLANAGMGGAENYVMLLANEHAARGGRSHVIVLTEPGPISRRIDPAVEVTYLGYRRDSIRNPFRFAASIVKGYRLIAGALRDNGVQVLQTHLPDTNLWGLVLSLRGVCRVVITIHNNRFLRDMGAQGLGRWVKLTAYRMMLQRCGAVVTVTGEVRKSLLATLGVTPTAASRVSVVDNGVPVPDPLPADEIEEIRASRGIEPDETWVVAAGRLTEAKNFDCLVRAAAMLRDQGRRFRFLIAGEGELREDLEQAIAQWRVTETVDLAGNIDDLGKVMMAADLLAMPSLWEGLPLTLLESLARGLPVVGTRINGLIDIVSEGEHGFLVEVDDYDALAAAMARLQDDSGLREQMGQNCLRLAREKYDFRRVYEDLASIYSRVTMD